MSEQILYLHDANGKLIAVQITPELWKKLEPSISAIDQESDQAAFQEFLDAWSFNYPYKPSVSCPACASTTEDWRNDGKFTLANANIGGMLVFHCNQCGCTIRQKYFKNHMDCDFTPQDR